MKRGFDLLAEHKGIALDLATIPAEDPRTYAMIRKADTLGTFQIESRAQMAMLPRHQAAHLLRPRHRGGDRPARPDPGRHGASLSAPARRARSRSSIPKPELEKVLGKTLGVPLFQEQAMRVAIECAGFTPGEADQLRRAMATFKFTGGVSQFQDKLVAGMVAQRLRARTSPSRPSSSSRASAATAFPESHAASLRADRLCLVLAEVPASGRVLRGAAQRPADGLLRAGADRARRARARRRGPPGLRQRLALGLHAGADRRRAIASPCGSACAWCAGSPTPMPPRSSPPAPTSPFARVDDLWRRAGVPVAALVAARRGRRLPARRSAWPGARRSGRSRLVGDFWIECFSKSFFICLTSPFIEELIHISKHRATNRFSTHKFLLWL